VCNDWYARGEASRAPDLAVYNKAFFWVSPLADFPESLAFRAGKILIAPTRRKYEASSGKIRQSEISLVLLWQNAISRKIKNRSERWNQGAAAVWATDRVEPDPTLISRDRHGSFLNRQFVHFSFASLE
jgi:hypothetical protein